MEDCGGMSKCWANIDKVKGSSNTTLNVFFDKNATGENRMVKISISNLEKNISKEVVLVQKATSDMFFGEYSETFKKNDCVNGGEGSDVILTEKDLDCYPVVSFVSQEDANEKAKKLLIENGQAIANSKGYCTWSGKYSHKFTKECGPCKIGEEVTISEEYMDGYPFLSTLSKEDADSIAKEAVLNDGQSVANDIGRCYDMFKGEYEKVFYKQDCEECMSDRNGYVVKAEMTSGYPYCDADEMSANNRAKLAVEAEGQEIANKNSTCVRIQGEPVWVDQGEVYCNGCDSVIMQIDTNKCSPTYNSFREASRPGSDCSQNGNWSEWEVFCDGYTEKRKRVNSCGANQEEILEENSEDCGYVTNREPRWEAFGDPYCENCEGKQLYKDVNPDSPTYGNTEVRSDSSLSCEDSGTWSEWETFCDGYTQKRRRTNSCGASQEEVLEVNSENCGYVVDREPRWEKVGSSYCENCTGYQKYEDTNTNSPTYGNVEIREESSKNCDSTGNWTDWDTYCDGNGNLRRSRVNSCGATEDELVEENSDECKGVVTYTSTKTNTIAYRKTDGCECPGNEVVIGSIEATATSTVSQSDADRLAVEKANQLAESRAESLGCGTLYLNKEVTKYKQGCGSNCVAPSYTIEAGAYKSCTSSEAQRLADDEAQRLANEMKCDCTYTSTKTNTQNFCKEGYDEFATDDQCVCQGKCVYAGEVSASATSKESQDDADAKAEALANQNAKNLADTYECGDVYYSEASVITKQKNDCGAWCTGSMVDYPVEAGIKFSCISQDDANYKRNVEIESNDYQNAAQSYANAHGSCNCIPEPGSINVYVVPSKSGMVSFNGSISSTNGVVDSSISVEDVTGSTLVASNDNVSPGVYSISVSGVASMRCTTEGGEATTETTYSLSDSSINVESGVTYSVYIEVNSDCSDIEETVYADDINVTVYRSNESCQSDASYGANCVGDQYTYFVDGSRFSGSSKVEANNKRDAWISSFEGKSIMQAEANSKGTCTCPSTDDCEITVSSDVYANASIDKENHAFRVDLFHRISSINCSPGGCGDYIFNMSLSEDGTSNVHDNESLTYSCGQTTDDFENVDGYYQTGLSAILPEKYWGEPDTDEFYDGLSYTINTYSSSSNSEASLNGGAHTISINVTDVHTGNSGPFS